ncbi:MAG: hypothetical protein JXA20_04290 [Spirochaetes bacterium]|nr:hypothetical protein [Spirochaetota bacterium]
MTQCAYHGDKTATTKCSRCNRPICGEDGRELVETRSSGETRIHYTCCIPCWAERAERYPKMGLGFLFGGITSLIPQVYYFSWEVPPERKIWTVAWLAVSALFILIGKSYIGRGKQELRERMRIRNAFLRTVDDGSLLIRDNRVVITCCQCHGELSPNQQFCPRCGFVASGSGGELYP